MRRPSTTSSTQLNPNQFLKPALQLALSSLDVQLEEELARYRRQRVGQPIPSPRGLGRKRNRGKSLDLISVEATGGRTKTQATPQSTNAPQSTAIASPLATVNPSVAEASTLQPTPTPSPDQAKGSESAIASLSSQLALTTRTEEPGPNTAGSLTNAADPAADPDDYLESSEQLLRSLAEEEAQIRARRPSSSLMTSLLTPLGIGSMLLLLLSSVTFGYVLMNPSSLGFLRIGRANQDSAPEVTEEGTASGGQASTTTSPNLAEREFVDLNLNTLSTLETRSGSTGSPLPNPQVAPTTAATAITPSRTQAQPTPTAVPVPVNRPAPAARPTVVQPTSVTPARPAPTRPAPTRPAPAAYNPPAAPEVPAVAPAAPAPAPATPTAPQAATGDYHYVVTDYSGDRALEEARTVVPGAYVRNSPEGAHVQLGAFTEAERAEELVQELQNQGIQAEVYQP